MFSLLSDTISVKEFIMWTIARHQLLSGFRNAKYIFLAALVILSFIANAFVYSEKYQQNYQDWRDSIHNNTNMLEEYSYSLQQLVNYEQIAVKPPSAIAFLADGGESMLPNSLSSVNAFIYLNPERFSRGNKILPVIGSLDWAFIVGTLMTLLAVLISYNVICGEKRDGTLRMILAQQVSRCKVFLGKYLGILFVLLITFFVGAIINILILVFYNALPLTENIIITIGWAVLLSVLCLSAILLTGMAVSSLARRPAVALVLLMIGWVLFVVAVPGIGRLIAEQSIEVRSPFDLENELELLLREVEDEIPTEGKVWNGDPFGENIPLRGEWRRRQTTAIQNIDNESNSEKILQAELNNNISFISPMGMLGTALQALSGTGVTGFNLLLRTARRYQQQLYSFTVERDRTDNESPHLIYYSFGYDRGVISTKPVEVSAVPRWHNLWQEGGLPIEQSWPVLQLILLIACNLQMALFAFIALARYDPR